MYLSTNSPFLSLSTISSKSDFKCSLTGAWCNTYITLLIYILTNRYISIPHLYIVLSPNHIHSTLHYPVHTLDPKLQKNQFYKIILFIAHFVIETILNNAHLTIYISMSLIITIAVWCSFHTKFNVSRKLPCNEFSTSIRT